MTVRVAVRKDREEWLRLRHSLWSDATLAELSAELDEHIKGDMPIIAFVLERPDGKLGGFLEASVRPWAEGCTAPNVGYIEGWYVDPDLRARGYGKQLVQAAEGWARARGCTEMGSDALVANLEGLKVHQALGYEERSINIHFRKLL